MKFSKHIHLKKKLTFCSILLVFFISVIFSPLQCFFFIDALANASCSLWPFIGESVKMRDLTSFLCLLSHLSSGFGNGHTSSGERLFLLCPKIPYAIWVLAKGTEISWLGSPFFIRIRDGSKSSSLKTSCVNGHIPDLEKLPLYSLQKKKLDMQHLSMMPGQGLLLLYQD